MTGIAEIAGHWWLGLCRKAPVVRISPAAMVNLPEHAHEGLPDGGRGGSGTIRRGIGAALSGTKSLIQNRQLRWFTLLAGLVLGGNIVAQSARWYVSHWTTSVIFNWQVMAFLIEFATLFCLVFLLAGLVLSVPSQKESAASFFSGLAGTGKYLKALTVWSLVLALAGMLIYSCWYNLLFLNIFGTFDSFLFSTLSQFPFNITLIPESKIFSELPVDGGRSLLSWIYPFGIMQTLIFSAINLLLLILTPFVVPSIVLGQKTLKDAVVGSFALMKKAWVETATCAVFLGIVAYGVFLTYLLVLAVHGIVHPSWVLPSRPTDTWIALGLLYDLALCSAAFVVATIGGIAALDLYRSAKTGQKPGSVEPELPV
jgi:hypothetical protein